MSSGDHGPLRSPRQTLRDHARVLAAPRARLSAALTLFVVAAAAASVGAYGTFTSTDSVSHSVTTGTVTIALGATGASTNRLNVNATAVAPGDTIQRSLDLSNTGSLDLASITLTTTATTSSLLDTDGTNGLQMKIERCSQAWTEGGSAPAYTYTCGGSTTTVLAQRAVIGSSLALSNLTATTAGSTDHLRVTLTLPSSAGNTFQGLTSTIQYAFTGTQRAATDR
jgi:spore coat-associated protein N